jgi:hypothetical protein
MDRLPRAHWTVSPSSCAVPCVVVGLAADVDALWRPLWECATPTAYIVVGYAASRQWRASAWPRERAGAVGRITRKGHVI